MMLIYDEYIPVLGTIYKNEAGAFVKNLYMEVDFFETWILTLLQILVNESLYLIQFKQGFYRSKTVNINLLKCLSDLFEGLCVRIEN